MRRGIALSALLLLFGLSAATARAAGPSFTVRGSVEQVDVTGLSGGEPGTLLDHRGKRVQSAKADSLGGLLFRNVKPGAGYTVSAGGATSAPVTVLTTSPAPPSTSLYNQAIPASGYGYLTTRDGTKLAIDVHLPSDIKSVVPAGSGISVPASAAQYPTLIEYAGYGYADPSGPQNGIATLANLMGFAVVDVNMRGTGCSGGAYDYFEQLQNLDGYDVIETVAHQPWVLHHKVGMMGISYGAISQLFTAQTDPPDLAAISPLSTIDQTQTTLYPGGILNTGFAVPWAEERVHDALPASATGGQTYAYKQIQSGDATCRSNQTLHGEAVNLLAKIRANSHYVPSVADPLAPTTFVSRIKVPVFMACQWTDEQTGGHCPDLAEHMTGTKRKWFTFTNGDHIDSLDPATLNRWFDFLQLYVAQQSPAAGSAVIHVGAPIIYKTAMGIDGVQLPVDPIQQQPTFASALAAFEKLPSVRVLFDNGAGRPDQPYFPYDGYEHSWPGFPIAHTRGQTWYLGAKGTLNATKSRHMTINQFTWNPRARPANDFSGDTASGTNGLWTNTPNYHWRSDPAGSAVSYLTAPLRTNTTVVGAGAVHLWIRAGVSNVDLQATVTEVRPDGKETFVQSGWLRTNERKLDRRLSSPLEPVLSLRAKDVASLPKNRFVQVTIPLYYEGHGYRKGSRIRVEISAPNGDQPIWAFAQTSPRRTTTVAVEMARKAPSSLVLPVVAGTSVPTPLPPCPSLRGEPCRAYVPYTDETIKR